VSKLRRKIGPGAAILFKGSGFYKTDYRSETYKKAAQAESKPSESSHNGTSNTSAKSEPAKASTTTPSNGTA
jgi:predicted nucleic acid-binding Zn ribbon protein